MPNIMLTYKCNLKCPYCFANEFVNQDTHDITEEKFDMAVTFLTKDGAAHFGLIGGEPTLHPQFSGFLEKIIKNPLIKEVTIYTNGILLDKYIKLIVNPKFRLLVNCNAPSLIGESKYKKLCNNLDILIKEYYMKERINLGYNFYSDDAEYEYIIELLKRYDLHRVRLTWTVPNFLKEETINAINFFKERKNALLNLLQRFDENTILPYYDCNLPPWCVWTEDEKKWLQEYVEKYKVKESNLIDNRSVCYPVIDILPDLTAVRCFGMSCFEKIYINDFKTITDIASYFINHIDAEAYRISACDDCLDCYERKIRHCTCGCIGFKQGEIFKLNKQLSF